VIRTRSRTVYFGDDDSSGLIYFPAYFQYMSEGDQELLAELGFPVHGQVAARVTVPVVHAECDCLAPARAGDLLAQQISLRLGARTSTLTEHEFRRGEVLVARGRIVRAWVDLDRMRPVEVPAAFRATVSSAAPEA
jgi:YbgC/YbaW family acyl-CoA thioester hydrolase